MPTCSQVPLKLLAFEHLLHAQRSGAHGNHLAQHGVKPLRLLLRGIAPDARPEDHARVSHDVTALVQRINERFPRAVHWEECESMPLAERLALLQVADVLLVTSVRDAALPQRPLTSHGGH